jgi:hypothetical protein
MADGRQRAQQRDQAVVATRTQVPGGVAQRVQVRERDRLARPALQIGVIGVAAQPLRVDASVGAQPRSQPQPRPARPQRRRQAGDHPRLLGLVELGKLGLQLKRLRRAHATAVVREVLLGDPAARTRTCLGLEQQPTGVDHVGLPGVVLADQDGKAA